MSANEPEAVRVARFRRDEAVSRAADADLAYRIAIERHSQVTRLLSDASQERDVANDSLAKATKELAAMLAKETQP